MRALIPALAALALICVAGCGSPRQSAIATSGEVLFGGKPLSKAGVMFCPTSGRPGVAMTDEHGRFALRTWTDADGAVEGEHVVCITKFVMDAADAAGALYPQGKNILPEQYASPRTSPLRATVSRKGPNTFRFDLE